MSSTGTGGSSTTRRADRLVPHPVYGGRRWVSVVVPGPRTWDDIMRLVEHARTQAARRQERRAATD